MWDHVAEAHGGLGNEEPHKDFSFFLSNTFTKPLERQVDEMRRLDLVEREGRATIMVKGKAKEIKTCQESLNRKEERFNLGRGRVRANFGQPRGNPRPPAPPPPPPPPPPPSPPPPPPWTGRLSVDGRSTPLPGCMSAQITARTSNISKNTEHNHGFPVQSVAI